MLAQYDGSGPRVLLLLFRGTQACLSCLGTRFRSIGMAQAIGREDRLTGGPHRNAAVLMLRPGGPMKLHRLCTQPFNWGATDCRRSFPVRFNSAENCFEQRLGF